MAKQRIAELYLRCIVFAVVIYIDVSSVVIFFFFYVEKNSCLCFCLIVEMVNWFGHGVTTSKM